MKRKVTIELNEREIASMTLLRGTLKAKVRAVLAMHGEKLAKSLEVGSPSKREAILRLYLCRRLEPEVSWELVRWKFPRKPYYFAPHRLDGNTQLGDCVKHVVVEKGSTA